MKEYETDNSYKNYPLSSEDKIVSSDGAEFPTDVLVDAIIYPVGMSGTLRLLEFDTISGTMRITDDSGELDISGQEENGTIRLYQSDKYAGTVICGPGLDREKLAGKDWKFDSVRFSSRCVVPFPGNALTSLSIDGRDLKCSSKIVGLYGRRLVAKEWIEKIDGVEYGTLQFNVYPKTKSESKTETTNRIPIRKIVVVHKKGSLLDFLGGAPFRDGFAWSAAGITVYAPYFTREDICHQANRSSDVVSIYDTCSEDGKIPCIDVDIPPSDQDKVRELCFSRIHIVSPDFISHRNALKISRIVGETTPNVPKMDSVMKMEDAESEAEKLTRAPSSSGNGIKFEIPGSGA